MHYTKILENVAQVEAEQVAKALNRQMDDIFFTPGQKRFERLVGEAGESHVFLISSEKPAVPAIEQLVTFALGLKSGFVNWYRPEQPDAKAESAS